MDQKQIEKLMAAMETSRIKRIVIKREDFEIEIERECASVPSTYAPPPVYAHPPAVHEIRSKIPLEPSAVSEGEVKEKPAGHYVTSPMVGTFYAAPSPDDPSFVKVGDSVNEDSIVCIIEAMKVMNEVKAGIKGTISEILVNSGEPVEFGTRIFRIQLA
jgi:acetyl-CoA carboxylase biotin carboxyl carrier protein